MESEARKLCDLGKEYLDRGEPEEALRCYERAIDVEPDNADAWCGRGKASYDLGRLERASGGVPLFALDIVRAVRQSGTPMTHGSILPVPVEVDRLIAPRLAALPEATRRLVVAAAAVGRPTLGLLSRLTRRRDVRPVLAPAIDAGLLRMDADRVRFVHPLYQSAVYRAEGTERLRRLHRRLASVLVDPDEAASHRALSADGPDETVAASVAAAADDAQRRGALDTAAALFEHAIRLTAADAVLQRQDRTIALARVCWELGDVERSRALTGEVLQAVGEGRTRAAALVLEGMHVLWSRGAGDAIPILLAGVALLGVLEIEKALLRRFKVFDELA